MIVINVLIKIVLVLSWIFPLNCKALDQTEKAIASRTPVLLILSPEKFPDDGQEADPQSQRKDNRKSLSGSKVRLNRTSFVEFGSLFNSRFPFRSVPDRFSWANRFLVSEYAKFLRTTTHSNDLWKWSPAQNEKSKQLGENTKVKNFPRFSLKLPSGSFDDEFRGKITRHVAKYKGLFSGAGLRQANGFVMELGKLIQNQILLRADYEELQYDLLSLESDYLKLKEISSPTSDIDKVNNGLLEILKVATEEEIGLEFMNAHHFDRQVFAIDVIRYEVKLFPQVMLERLKKISSNSPPELFSSVINLQTLLYNFLSKYKSFFHDMELERHKFCYMLRKYSDNSRKDILFNSTLRELDKVIGAYIEVSKNGKKRSKNPSSTKTKDNSDQRDKETRLLG